jgi:hypothetical protein
MCQVFEYKMCGCSRVIFSIFSIARFLKHLNVLSKCQVLKYLNVEQWARFFELEVFRI